MVVSSVFSVSGSPAGRGHPLDGAAARSSTSHRAIRDIATFAPASILARRERGWHEETPGDVMRDEWRTAVLVAPTRASSDPG
jgi:hypothetical protein